MRKIDLGPDFIGFGARRPRRPGCGLGIGSTANMRAHLFGFMVFN